MGLQWQVATVVVIHLMLLVTENQNDVSQDVVSGIATTVVAAVMMITSNHGVETEIVKHEIVMMKRQLLLTVVVVVVVVVGWGGGTVSETASRENVSHDAVTMIIVGVIIIVKDHGRGKDHGTDQGTDHEKEAENRLPHQAHL